MLFINQLKVAYISYGIKFMILDLFPKAYAIIIK